jgi:hypothetical protein
MHHDWFGAVFVDRLGRPAHAALAALMNRLTDGATHAKVARSAANDGRPVPTITQGEIADGVYGAIGKGFAPVYEKIVAFHFPPASDDAGPCGEPDWSRFKTLAAEYNAHVGADVVDEVPVLALARLGIEGHRAMDRHAHQGFRGTTDKRNARKRPDCLAWFMPDKLATGHSEFRNLPDRIEAKWERNGVWIDNRLRFIDAGMHLWNSLLPESPVKVINDHGVVRCAYVGNESQCPTSLLILSQCKNSKHLRRLAREFFARVADYNLPSYRMPSFDSVEWRAFCIAAREVFATQQGGIR